MDRMRTYICVLAVLSVVAFAFPLPTPTLDFLILLNIVFSVVVSLVALTTKSPLSFFKFPSILLTLTVFHITISVSIARIILGNAGVAGNIIRSFGVFIVGANIVFGFIIFLIIMLTQLIVIIKCTEYVSKTSAWFIQNAVPGKQMCVDADLDAGIIDKVTADKRRFNIQREAGFFDSMVVTSKFVIGNAVFIILVVVLTLIGGLNIGTNTYGMDYSTALNIYATAMIGYGLTSTIPVLLITASMRISATKVSQAEM